MAFRGQRYRTIFWYAAVMFTIYSVMAYLILNKLNRYKQNQNRRVFTPNPLLLAELQPINISSDLEPLEVEKISLSKLESIEAERSAQAKLEAMKIDRNILKKSEVLVDTANTYKPIFKSNSTHIWDMRVADEKYFRLATQLSCRTIEYDVGLPSADTIDSCIQSSANEFAIEHTIEAQKWIFNHQNPSNCNNKQFAIIKNIAWSGFSSSMHLIAWAFAKALTQDRIAVYDTPANWVFGACDSSNPDCVFLPLSSCSNFKSLNGTTVISIDANTNEFPDSIPMVFRRKSFIWYRSQLLFYLLRYNRDTLAYVHQKIAQSFVPPSIEAHKPYISIFARHPETMITKKKSKNLYSLNRYFELLTNASFSANITTVYLNSDEPTFSEEFTELNVNKSDRYTLLTMTLDKDLPFNVISSMPQDARTKNILDCLTDIYVQVHADVHIGTLASKYCRLVDALRLTLGKTIPFYTPDNLYLTHT